MSIDYVSKTITESSELQMNAWHNLGEVQLEQLPIAAGGGNSFKIQAFILDEGQASKTDLSEMILELRTKNINPIVTIISITNRLILNPGSLCTALVPNIKRSDGLIVFMRSSADKVKIRVTVEHS